MNRLELADKIAAAHGVSKAEGARILATVTEAIVASVKKGDPVQIVGFGTFKQVARAARAGFNPRAGITLWQKMAAANKGWNEDQDRRTESAEVCRRRRFQGCR